MTSLKHSSFSGLVGVAREDITSPIRIYSRNWGAAKHDVAEGIHRRLSLTCVTFQSSKQQKPLVLISADLGWWKNSEDESFVRGKILRSLSLDESRLMFCLTHTHAGPSLCRDDAEKPGGKLIEPYLRRLQRKAIRAVRRAIACAQPAVLTWRYGKCDLAANRDLPQPAKKRFLVGFNPEQNADDTLLVGRITNAKGKIITILVNYACHPTTLAWDNDLISSDYVGGMRELVEGQTHAPCAFLQGASGELAPAEQYSGDTRLADKHGRRLGYAVLSTLEAMPPPEMDLEFKGVVESGAPLALWKLSKRKTSKIVSSAMTQVELPLKSSPSISEIEQSFRDCTDPILKERLGRQLGVRKSVGDGQSTRLPVWVWQLGDATLVGQPTETYSCFQREVRDHFSNAIAVMNVVNGHIGYLPPKNLYGENVYSVWQTPFAQGSLELLIRKAIEAVRRSRGERK